MSGKEQACHRELEQAGIEGDVSFFRVLYIAVFLNLPSSHVVLTPTIQLFSLHFIPVILLLP